MFEKASRLKIRFDTTKGQLTVEELWDLPLSSATKVNLDDIAKGLYKQLKEADDILSFVSKEQKTDDVTQLKFDLVKHVIDVRLAENQVAAEAKARAEKKQQIMGLIVQKENEALAGQSVEDLRQLLAAL